jgi:hypothetical protein
LGLGIAVVSVAFQLTEACIKLYKFWESIEDAPHEIAAIKEDLQYLIFVFKRVESGGYASGQCVAEGLHSCRKKVAVCIARRTMFDILMV